MKMSPYILSLMGALALPSLSLADQEILHTSDKIRLRLSDDCKNVVKLRQYEGRVQELKSTLTCHKVDIGFQTNHTVTGEVERVRLQAGYTLDFGNLKLRVGGERELQRGEVPINSFEVGTLLEINPLFSLHGEYTQNNEEKREEEFVLGASFGNEMRNGNTISLGGEIEWTDVGGTRKKTEYSFGLGFSNGNDGIIIESVYTKYPNKEHDITGRIVFSWKF